MPPLPGRSHSTGSVLLEGEGLPPSALRFRLTRAGERCTVVKGPLAGPHEERIGGFCRMELGSLDEMLAFTDRFVHILGGTRELDLCPVAEA